MRNLLAIAAMTVFSTAALTAPLWAETAGKLTVTQPMLRATAPGAPVAGGYLVVKNTGETDDRLVAASIALETVGKVELHEMKMDEGVMSMTEVDGGIVIPAGETVTLQPGGLHLMLMGLTGPLEVGDTHSITLTFEGAGEVVLDAPVASLGDIRDAFADAKASGHGGHGHAGHGDGHHGHSHAEHGH